MPTRIHSDAYFLPGSRRGALLLHGFTASPTETRPLGEFLHRRGMTVLGVRLPGHGTSPEDLAGTRWEDWYRAAEDGLWRLRENVDRSMVAGISLGGVLAAMLAADHPEAVTGISLLSPSFFPRSWLFFLAPLVARCCAELSKGLARRAYYERHGLFSYDVRPTRSLVELRKVTRLGYRRLGEVKTPAQVIMGRRDRLIDPASGERILARLAGSRKELHWAERSDHILTVEPDAPEVLERVWEFFESL